MIFDVEVYNTLKFKPQAGQSRHSAADTSQNQLNEASFVYSEEEFYTEANTSQNQTAEPIQNTNTKRCRCGTDEHLRTSNKKCSRYKYTQTLVNNIEVN